MARRSSGRGALEFRAILGASAVIALVSDFEPRLPWYVYKLTQAVGRNILQVGDARPEVPAPVRAVLASLRRASVADAVYLRSLPVRTLGAGALGTFDVEGPSATH